MSITSLSTVVMFVSHRKHLSSSVWKRCVFVFMARSPPLSFPVFVHPAESSFFFFIKRIIVDPCRDGSLGFTGHTERDAISNRCHAFICSACAWRGPRITSWSPHRLWSTQPSERQRGRAADWKSHSSVCRAKWCASFLMGCSPRCCSHT